jgi:hypothetical protein
LIRRELGSLENVCTCFTREEKEREGRVKGERGGESDDKETTLRYVQYVQVEELKKLGDLIDRSIV